MNVGDIYIRTAACQKIVIITLISEDRIYFRKLGTNEHIDTNHSKETFERRFVKVE